MKPYKILRPEKSLGNSNIDLTISEKKLVKLPLKLFMKCSPIPRNNHISETVKVKNYE